MKCRQKSPCFERILAGFDELTVGHFGEFKCKGSTINHLGGGHGGNRKKIDSEGLQENKIETGGSPKNKN